MNGVHIHLLLNHFPILGPLFALALLLFGYFLKKDILCRAALWTLVVVSLITIPVFLSGEEAEHSVEGIIGVSEVSIEEHEEQAELAYWTMLVSGAIALGTLLAGRKSESLNRILLAINIAFIVVSFLLMARTGNSGGSIRHPEIHGTSADASGAYGEEESLHED
ncbi:MAG: hypothetical protein ACK5C5_11220 [Bacteroidota bacterium]|jgi:uncharacterized membrane protein